MKQNGLQKVFVEKRPRDWEGNFIMVGNLFYYGRQLHNNHKIWTDICTLEQNSTA